MNERAPARARARDYVADVTEAVGELHTRFPGRIPEATTAALARDLCRAHVAAEDVAAAVSFVARTSAFYTEQALWDAIRAARAERMRSSAPALAAVNARSPADERAGRIVGRLIVRAIARDAKAFATVKPEAMTARQNALRDQIRAVIEAEPTIGDEALMARFGRAPEMQAGLTPAMEVANG